LSPSNLVLKAESDQYIINSQCSLNLK